MSIDKTNMPVPPRRFCGKWHKREYTILGELGRGANGVVYLAECGSQKVAVKLAPDGLDSLVEVNVLKALQQTRDGKVGPQLCDVDDVLIHGKTFTFYAMEYVQGERLDDFMRRFGKEWLGVMALQLLSRLEKLHIQGWIFGDLKPENVIVERKDKQIRLIDFGGASKMGNAVRQFTEEYDRASWQAGDRKAEISYDLFSLAVMMIRLCAGSEAWKRIRSNQPHISHLYDIIRNDDELHVFRIPLTKALCGEYASAAAMKRDVLAALHNRMAENVRKGNDDRVGTWIGGVFVASLLLLAGSLYYLWM